jgi:hypothetical protein
MALDKASSYLTFDGAVACTQLVQQLVLELMLG